MNDQIPTVDKVTMFGAIDEAMAALAKCECGSIAKFMDRDIREIAPSNNGYRRWEFKGDKRLACEKHRVPARAFMLDGAVEQL